MSKQGAQREQILKVIVIIIISFKVINYYHFFQASKQPSLHFKQLCSEREAWMRIKEGSLHVGVHICVSRLYYILAICRLSIVSELVAPRKKREQEELESSSCRFGFQMRFPSACRSKLKPLNFVAGLRKQRSSA